LQEVQDEINWGDYHSSELGILEIISLRVNKALLAIVGGDFLPAAARRENVILWFGW